MKFLLKENLDFLNTLKEDGKKIVFTNGCFDIIHPGHIHILEEAKSYGDVLIVGLNSNRSGEVGAPPPLDFSKITKTTLSSTNSN